MRMPEPNPDFACNGGLKFRNKYTDFTLTSL